MCTVIEALQRPFISRSAEYSFSRLASLESKWYKAFNAFLYHECWEKRCHIIYTSFFKCGGVASTDAARELAAMNLKLFDSTVVPSSRRS